MVRIVSGEELVRSLPRDQLDWLLDTYCRAQAAAITGDVDSGLQMLQEAAAAAVQDPRSGQAWSGDLLLWLERALHYYRCHWMTGSTSGEDVR